MLSRLVITFLPRSKCLLISWLQSPSAVILEPKKIKFLTVSIVSPSICHEVIGLPANSRAGRPWAHISFSISPSNEHPGLISYRMDWLDLLAVQGTLESSPTPQFKNIHSSVLSFLYSPTLTSIYDYWENYSFD